MSATEPLDATSRATPHRNPMKVTLMGIKVSFDRDSDVLYTSLGDPVPCLSEDGANGLVLRRDVENGLPSGVTVLYVDQWRDKLGELSRRIGGFLGIAPADIFVAIKAALQPL
jgi:hypothetical protein